VIVRAGSARAQREPPATTRALTAARAISAIRAVPAWSTVAQVRRFSPPPRVATRRLPGGAARANAAIAANGARGAARCPATSKTA
jgi:hypothetical protein